MRARGDRGGETEDGGVGGWVQGHWNGALVSKVTLFIYCLLAGPPRSVIGQQWAGVVIALLEEGRTWVGCHVTLTYWLTPKDRGCKNSII